MTERHTSQFSLQRPVPTTQIVHKMMEVAQSQYLNRVVDVPVVMQRLTSETLKVTRIAEVPRCRSMTVDVCGTSVQSTSRQAMIDYGTDVVETPVVVPGSRMQNQNTVLQRHSSTQARRNTNSLNSRSTSFHELAQEHRPSNVSRDVSPSPSRAQDL